MMIWTIYFIIFMYTNNKNAWCLREPGTILGVKGEVTQNGPTCPPKYHKQIVRAKTGKYRVLQQLCTLSDNVSEASSFF